MKRGLILFSASLLPLLGCKSPFVDATVRNASPDAITLIEVQYPGASFGFQSIPAGGERHYRFKILGDGATRVSFTDHTGREHHVPGPALHDGQSGSLRITVRGDDVTWDPRLTP